MQSSAKILIIAGVIITLVGLIYYFFGDKLQVIGRLPGDIAIERPNFRFYFPLTTMIIFSILINVVFRLVNYLMR